MDQLEDIDRSLEKFPHCDLADARDGFKVVEMPIVFTERLHGHSKMSGHIVLEAIIMVWRLWFQNGLRRWSRKSR